MTTSRATRHRLRPGLALHTLAEAAAFVAELGVVLQAPHPHLPSVFGAAQGAPAKPGAGGFGDWPAHAWSWPGELAARDDILMTKVLLGKRTLVHARLWPALDAAVRGRGAASPDEDSIVRCLTKDGCRSDELPARAALDAKACKRALSALEARGTVLVRPVLLAHHKHTAIAELWTARFPRPLAPQRGPLRSGAPRSNSPPAPRTPDAFIAAALWAAGDAPARDVPRWFAWPRVEVTAALDRLIESGDVQRRGDLLVATGAE